MNKNDNQVCQRAVESTTILLCMLKKTEIFRKFKFHYNQLFQKIRLNGRNLFKKVWKVFFLKEIRLQKIQNYFIALIQNFARMDVKVWMTCVQSSSWRFILHIVSIFKMVWNFLKNFLYSDQTFLRNIFVPPCLKCETSWNS